MNRELVEKMKLAKYYYAEQVNSLVDRYNVIKGQTPDDIVQLNSVAIKANEFKEQFTDTKTDMENYAVTSKYPSDTLLSATGVKVELTETMYTVGGYEESLCHKYAVPTKKIERDEMPMLDDDENKYLGDTVKAADGDKNKYLGDTRKAVDGDKDKYLGDTRKAVDDDKDKYLGDTRKAVDDDENKYLGDTVKAADGDKNKYLGDTRKAVDGDKDKYLGDTVKAADGDKNKYLGDTTKPDDDSHEMFYDGGMSL